MVLPMRRVVSNLVFATFTIAIGCIIGWSFRKIVKKLYIYYLRALLQELTTQLEKYS